jgi:hypothetical protein
MSTKIPVSIGELWDKLSILLIKNEKIVNMEKLEKIKSEIGYLRELIDSTIIEHELFVQLKDVNGKLWEIEDKLRIKETEKMFDDEFIALARAVYYTNDERFELKRQINILHNSDVHEVKHYVVYK